MRPAALLIGLILLAPTEAAAAPFRRAPTARLGPALGPGDAVPVVAGAGLDGKEAEISYAAAKLTLVNFWATWCVPCRQEMPALEKIRARHGGKKLQVVGALINDPATPEEVRKAVEDAGVKYAIVAVPDGTGASWGGLTLIPTTFLVDGEGKLVRKFVGIDEKGMEALSRDVADYLAGRPLGNPYIAPPVPDAAPVQ